MAVWEVAILLEAVGTIVLSLVGTGGKPMSTWWLQLVYLGPAIEKLKAQMLAAVVGTTLKTGRVLSIRVFGGRWGVGVTLTKEG